MLGTVAYMSPEQVKAKELDARTDLFSFGAVLYEMATAKLPFNGSSAGDICGLIIHQEPVTPGEVNPKIPAGLEAVIRKALEKNRELRYQHAADMRTDLQRLKRDSETGRISVADSGTLKSARTPVARTATVWRMAALVLIVALLVTGGLYYRSHRQRSRRPKAPEHPAPAPPADRAAPRSAFVAPPCSSRSASSSRSLRRPARSP